MGLFGNNKNRQPPSALKIPATQPMPEPSGGITINGKVYYNKLAKKCNTTAKKKEAPVDPKQYGVYPDGSDSYFNAKKVNIRDVPPGAPRNGDRPCMCDKCVAKRYRNVSSDVPMSNKTLG